MAVEAGPAEQRASPFRPAAYARAALGTLVAFALRLALDDYLGPPYLLFYPVVVLVAFLGGLGPALFATALSAALTLGWILPRAHPQGGPTLREEVSLAVFCLVSAFLALVAGRYRASRRRLLALELERAREEATARFGTMADAAPLLIWISGAGGDWTWFNRTWLDFTGRTLAQEVGDGWSEGIHPDDRAGCLAAHRDHLARRAPLRLEYRLRRHDGTYRWLSATGAPRLDERGDFAGFVGFCLDLTERKEAEEALRVNQERLDLALRSGKTGLWDLDLATNRAWRTLQHDRIFGYEELQPTWGAEEALRHVIPEDQHTFRRAFEVARATGHFHYELRIQPPGLPVRWIAAEGELVRDAAGAPARLRGTVVDVTERKELDARIGRAERLDAVTTLVRGMSHEINSPLASVVSNLDYAREQLAAAPPDARAAWTAAGGGSLPELQEALLDAVASADRVKVIVKDLATFLPRARRSTRRADPAAVLREALELAAEELRPCAAVEVQVPALPDVAVGREELLQVLFSLLANAGQAAGAAPNLVRVAGRLDGPDLVTFTISDTGVGMTPFVMEHMYEPFFTTRGVGRGKGLGLPLCRGVIDSVGGAIAFDSAVERGTTVTVSLPTCHAGEG